MCKDVYLTPQLMEVPSVVFTCRLLLLSLFICKIINLHPIFASSLYKFKKRVACLFVFTNGMPFHSVILPYLMRRKWMFAKIPCFIYLNKKVPCGFSFLIPFSLTIVESGLQGSFFVFKQEFHAVYLHNWQISKKFL